MRVKKCQLLHAVSAMKKTTRGMNSLQSCPNTPNFFIKRSFYLIVSVLLGLTSVLFIWLIWRNENEYEGVNTYHVDYSFWTIVIS